MKKSFVLFTALLLLSASLFPADASASGGKGRPRWITQPPVASNNTFEYRVVFVDAKSISEARNMLSLELSNYLETTKNVKIATASGIKKEGDNGQYNEQSTFEMKAVIEGEPVTVTAKIIDEYYEPGPYMGNYYFLVAVGNPKASSVNFDRTQITDKYGASGLWRSAICPGWGQMYKGSQTKGFVILGAEVAAIGGIVAFESMRSSYVSKAKHQPSYMQQYMAKANNCRNISYGFIAGAAAVYVYNLIDAIAAPGLRYVKTSKSGLAFYPTISPEATGIAVAYRF